MITLNLGQMEKILILMKILVKITDSSQRTRIKELKTNLTHSSRTLVQTNSKTSGNSGRDKLITSSPKSNSTTCRQMTARSQTTKQIKLMRASVPTGSEAASLMPIALGPPPTVKMHSLTN